MDQTTTRLVSELKDTVMIRVKSMLEESRWFRDDLHGLIYEYWNRYENIESSLTGPLQFKAWWRDCTQPETIRRAWQKVQEPEENSHLRGKLWAKRHHIGDQVRQEINTL
jgi:hypothetical protein